MENKVPTASGAPRKQAENAEACKVSGSPAGTTLLLLSLKAPCLCRHVLNDIHKLLPKNTARDAKFGSRFNLRSVLEVADLKDADNVFLIETRKKEPMPYLWIVVSGNSSGKEDASILKFSITGMFTMQELKFPGNPFSHSQMVALFSADFDKSEGWRRIRACLAQIFNTVKEPQAGDPLVEGCVDKVASFFIVEEAIVARFYHVQRRAEEAPAQGGDGLGAIDVVEIGPRFTLIPRAPETD